MQDPESFERSNRRFMIGLVLMAIISALSLGAIAGHRLGWF